MLLIPLICAFVVSLLGILALCPLAKKLGLMDAPGGRKTHGKHIPLVGGIGIFLGLIVGSLLMPDLMAHYHLLFGLSAILLITGLIDDLYHLSAISKIIVQIIVAWLMCFGGNHLIEQPLLIGAWALPTEPYSILITIFFTVGIINAINMIDGMDGLAGGMVIICLILLALTSNFVGANALLVNLSLLTIAGVSAFLLLNFRLFQKKSALIHLGDSGSMVLGFILAWLLIESSQGENRAIPLAIGLWYLAVPLMDVLYLSIARPVAGKSPFQSGMDHVHHRLKDFGLSNISAHNFKYHACYWAVEARIVSNDVLVSFFLLF